MVASARPIRDHLLRFWLRFWPLGLACLAAIVAFARCVGFPFLTWDDPLYVTQNPLVAAPFASDLKDLLLTPQLGYPAPVTVLTYAAERAVAGLAAPVFHFDNLALHLVNVALVYACARRLGAVAREAAFAAAIFGAHPLVVEPVCWVTGRKNLLAATLTLAAVLLVARDGARWTRWAAATALATLAILAKASAVTAPVLVAMTAWTAASRRDARAITLRAAPGVAIAAALTAVAYVGQSRVGAVEQARTWADVPVDVAAALAIQLGHLAWPARLATVYGELPGDPSIAAMVAASLVAIAAGVAAWRWGRTRERWGLAFAAIAYAPAAGLVLVKRFTADSYAYLPLAGVAIAVAAVAARVRAVGAGARRGVRGRDRGVGGGVDARDAGVVRVRRGVARDAAALPGRLFSLAQLARTDAAEGRVADAVDAYLKMDPSADDYLAERASYLERAGRRDRARPSSRAAWRKGTSTPCAITGTRFSIDPAPPSADERDAIARARSISDGRRCKTRLTRRSRSRRFRGDLCAEGLDDGACVASERASALRAR